jgi:hypothetical protein
LKCVFLLQQPCKGLFYKQGWRKLDKTKEFKKSNLKGNKPKNQGIEPTSNA